MQYGDDGIASGYSGCARFLRSVFVLFGSIAFTAGLLVGSGITAKASDAASPAQSVAALQGFLTSIDVPPQTRFDAQGPARSHDGAVRVAEADNAFDDWREMFEKKKEGAAPAVQPRPAIRPVKQAPVANARYVGSKVCLGCHTSQASKFEHTLMGRLLKQGKMQCETCHGPGSEHVRLGGGRGVGGIISFRPNDRSRTAAENNGICLGCHERGERTYWMGSTHQTRGLACTNCHTIMKAVSRKYQVKTAFEPDTCFQCHKDRRAQMERSSHMPLREGKMVCSDCHNPHGSPTEALLRGNSINGVCYKCHAEKRGPFLFEHLPVRENCDNCHDPHGTVNEYSLRLARPRLCFECHQFGHGATAGPLYSRNVSRACQNCHTAIHGSNSPAGVYLQR